jgi:tetratricopeptide (TPR) repeat protein
LKHPAHLDWSSCRSKTSAGNRLTTGCRGAFSDSLTVGLQGLENVVLVNRERLRELESGADAQHAAQVLGARYYVIGTYQRVGEDLRVVARLIEAKDGAIKYQEPPITDRFTNLLQIEDRLAQRFASALQLSSAIPRRIPTSSMTAYQAVAQANDLYLEGRYPEAIQKLERATAEDNRYAEAWALLGKSYAQRSSPNNIDRDTRSEFLERALRASLRAIELDSSLYEARVALAATYQQMEQVDSWRDAARKAIDMNPRLAEAYVLLGDSYGPSPGNGCSRERNVELAETQYRKALDLNPSFGAAHARLATTLSWSRRESDAVAVSKNAARLLPNNVLINRTLAGNLLWSGKADELETQTQKVASMTTSTMLDKWMIAVLDLFRGRNDEAAAKFKEVIAAGPTILREIDTGRIYAQAGRIKESAEHLQHAFEQDPACATFVSWSPAFAPYREDPVLRDLIARYAKSR